MVEVTVTNIVKTSIVTAFTVAAALIWRDVIVDIIELFVPPREEVFYKLLAAIIATILVIMAIYVILKTESEAEIVVRKFKHRRDGKKK